MHLFFKNDGRSLHVLTQSSNEKQGQLREQQMPSSRPCKMIKNFHSRVVH